MKDELIYPNTVIVGTLKSGTTALFHYLKAHPQVVGTDRKETHYFQDEDSSIFKPSWNYQNNGIEGYASFFNTTKKSDQTKVVLDSTPGYMYQEIALKVFSEEATLANTQIIFVLREPVSKLKSLFNFFCYTRLELPKELTFEGFVDLVENNDASIQWNEFLREAIVHSQYIDYIRKWTDACGKERIHIFLYEDFRNNNTLFMKKMSSILGIDPTFYDDFIFEKKNPTLYVKNLYFHKLIGTFKKMIPQSSLRNKLRAYYRSRNFTNTNVKIQPNNSEEALLEKLQNHYRVYNNQLANEFNLDLTPWNNSVKSKQEKIHNEVELNSIN